MELQANPAWLRPAAAFEITSEGTKGLPWQSGEKGVVFDLGTVNLTRMLIITADAYYDSMLPFAGLKESRQLLCR